MPLMKSLKNKAKKKENQQQKQQTEANRESGKQLVNGLHNAEISLSGLTNKDARQVFKNITQTLCQYIDNSPVIGHYDVAEMDQLLLDMVEIYNQALKNNDLDTAKRCVDRLHGGFADFRKELNTLELENMDSVLGERLEKLGEYKTILVVSNSVFVNRRNVETKEKEYLSLLKEYEELFQTVEKQTTERPDLYEKLQELRPGIDQVPEDAQELYTNLSNLSLISDQVDDLKIAMGIFRSEYNTQLTALKSMEQMLSIKNGLLSKEEEERMNEAIDRYHEHLQSAVLEVERLEELQEKRHIAITQIMSSMAVGKSVMKHTSKFEELKRRRQLEQEGVARGMELKQEQELEHDKQILTN